MRALVTGGAGFIGSHVVDHLIAAGHEVAVLDDLSGGFRENINSYARFYEGSICDEKLVRQIFEECSFDYVYHLAAYAAEGLSPFIRRFNYTNNVVGSVNLINSSVLHKIKCFVFTSSIAVYGSGQTPFTEEMIPHPEDPYGIAKYAVELDLAAAYRQFGLPYIIFRPHNVYGERQNVGDPYRNVIGIFMRQIMTGQPCTIFGDGEQTRAFTHVSEVAPLIADSVNRLFAYNETFNIGADEPLSVKTLAELVYLNMTGEYSWKGKEISVNCPITYLPERNEVKHAFSDHSKLEEYFPIRPEKIDLMIGLGRMAHWLREVGLRESKPFKNIEIEEGLPEVWRSIVECR